MTESQRIDPVECALAAVGIRAVISRAVEKVTAGTAAEMRGYDKRVRDLAQLVAGGAKLRIPLGDVSYEAMLRDLTDAHNEQQLTEMVRQFPLSMQDIVPEFLALADKATGYLRALLPMRTRPTLMGEVQLPPPLAAVRKFVAALIVLDDPMRVFALVATGSLLKQQAEAMKTVYPSMSSAITLALKDACDKEAARSKAYQLPALLEYGSRTWLGLPQASPGLTSALQANHEQAKQAAQNQRKNPASASIVAQQALSQTQKGLYRDALSTE